MEFDVYGFAGGVFRGGGRVGVGVRVGGFWRDVFFRVEVGRLG